MPPSPIGVRNEDAVWTTRQCLFILGLLMRTKRIPRSVRVTPRRCVHVLLTVVASWQVAWSLHAQSPAEVGAPSDLVATAVGTTQNILVWTDNATNETGFRIERCKGTTCTNFSLIATVGANVTSYSNTKLTANTTYRYRVYAYNASGNSGYSNIVTATTLRR